VEVSRLQTLQSLIDEFDFEGAKAVLLEVAAAYDSLAGAG
jgi:predicted RNA-binding protein with PIN domain